MTFRSPTIGRVDIFDPVVAFPVVFVAYFAAGYLFDLDRAAVAGATRFPWLMLSVSLVVFVVGALAGRWLNARTNPAPISLGVPWIPIASVFVAIGSVASVALIVTGQVGITGEDVRVAIDPLIAAAALLLWFGELYLLAVTVRTWKRRWLFWVAVAALLGVAALVGYRTPLAFIVIVAVAEWHYLIRPVSKRFVLAGAIVVVVALSALSVLRLFSEAEVPNAPTTTVSSAAAAPEVEGETPSTADAVQDELRARVRQHPLWLRRATGTAVSGRLALVRVIEYVDQEGPLNGELHWAAVVTALPGTQAAPRTIVTDVVNSVGTPLTREGLTTTPTLVGQLYLDGGWLLLLIGMAATGWVLGIWHAFAVAHREQYPGMAFGYGFALSVALVGIHTGVLDITLFGLLVIAALMTVAPGRPSEAAHGATIPDTEVTS